MSQSGHAPVCLDLCPRVNWGCDMQVDPVGGNITVATGCTYDCARLYQGTSLTGYTNATREHSCFGQLNAPVYISHGPPGNGIRPAWTIHCIIIGTDCTCDCTPLQGHWPHRIHQCIT